MSKKMAGTTQGWIDTLIGKEVVVVNRSEDDRYLGTLLHVDQEPIKSTIGPTVVLRSDEGRHTIVFDVSVISDEDVMPDDFSDDYDDNDEADDDVVKF